MGVATCVKRRAGYRRERRRVKRGEQEMRNDIWRDRDEWREGDM